MSCGCMDVYDRACKQNRRRTNWYDNILINDLYFCAAVVVVAVVFMLLPSLRSSGNRQTIQEMSFS